MALLSVSLYRLSSSVLMVVKRLVKILLMFLSTLCNATSTPWRDVWSRKPCRPRISERWKHNRESDTHNCWCATVSKDITAVSYEVKIVANQQPATDTWAQTDQYSLYMSKWRLCGICRLFHQPPHVSCLCEKHMHQQQKSTRYEGPLVHSTQQEYQQQALRSLLHAWLTDGVFVAQTSARTEKGTII